MWELLFILAQFGYMFSAGLQFWISTLWDEEDAISCLQPRFYVLQRSTLLFTHLLFSLRLRLTVSLACVYTGRQLVQKQASCPPPQTQRWRNWTLSTSSSFSSILNVSTDRQASRRLLRRLTSLPAHTSTHTHSFTLAQGFSYLETAVVYHLFATQSLKYVLALYSNIFLNILFDKWPQRNWAFMSYYTSAHVQLQPCVTFVFLLPDCSLKVKDVLREFDKDGRLAQHRHGEVRGRCVPVQPQSTLSRWC